jgi:hypothetical protein
MEKGNDALLPPGARQHMADQLAAEQRRHDAEEQLTADQPQLDDPGADHDDES